MNAVARFRAQPRAVRWGLVGGAVIVAYFAVVEPVMDRINAWNAAAATRESALASYVRSGPRLKTSGETVALGRREFGEVALPGEAQSRSVLFSEAIDDILRRHTIAELSTTPGKGSLGVGPLTRHLGDQYRVERVTKDLKFLATPEEAVSLLADLEREPLVATIPRVQVRQADGRQRADRMVDVTISVETWVTSRKEAK